MQIGTAAPTPEELSQVRHHMIACRSVVEPYSAGAYEEDVLPIIHDVIRRTGTAVVVGGSMMYLHAITHGIDPMPDADADLRRELWQEAERFGPEHIRMKLRRLDPRAYATIDPLNIQRIIHAIEMSLIAGRPYTELLSRRPKQRDFEIEKTGLLLDREELYRRIDARVTQMMDQGLEREARALYPLRELNALQTVGYKELFQHFDGLISLDEAIRLIRRNTRHYARKQMTWFRRDGEIRWLRP